MDVVFPFSIALAPEIQCTNISIINDIILEDDETFTVEISTDDPVELRTRTAMVNIVDDDGLFNVTCL